MGDCSVGTLLSHITALSHYFVLLTQPISHIYPPEIQSLLLRYLVAYPLLLIQSSLYSTHSPVGNRSKVECRKQGELFTLELQICR